MAFKGSDGSIRRYVDQPLGIACASTAVFIRDIAVCPAEMMDEATKRKLLLTATQRFLAYLQKDENACATFHAEGEKQIIGLFPDDGKPNPITGNSTIH